MRQILMLLIVAVLIAVARPTAAQQIRWLSYEPDTVELAGKLVVQKKYGPPNYGEQPKTDQRVKVPILMLSEPVNVLGNRGDNGFNGMDAFRVKQIQLAFTETGTNHSDLIGRQVVVKGSLFHRATGHHYTEVVMNVHSIERKPAGYDRQEAAVCSILTAYYDRSKHFATSNSLLVQFVAPVREGETVRSFKLPGTRLIINVIVKYAVPKSGGASKPEGVGMAIAVSDKEENARYVSDSFVAATNYKRNWRLSVTKEVVDGELLHSLTFSCADGSKQAKR